MKHAVIYIPGLGQDQPRAQQMLISTWRVWGVKPVLFSMAWNDERPYVHKFEQLLETIDTFTANGYKVSLVAASAGAGTGVNAFAARKDVVNGLVCICGKINHPEEIDPRYRDKNPSFVDSAERVPASLENLKAPKYLRRIMS